MRKSITHIIFEDGSQIEVKEAVTLIGKNEKSGKGIKAVCDDKHVVPVWWKHWCNYCSFETASGSTLHTEEVKLINDWQWVCK